MIVRSTQRSTLIKMSSCLSLSLEEAILNEFLLPNAALGYPLYSSRHQLDAHVATVESNIIRHVHLSKDRLLTIQDTCLVANSLLLCQLWHPLCVISVPGQWLNDIQTVVRKFLLPFWPTPFWFTLCQLGRKEINAFLNIHLNTH